LIIRTQKITFTIYQNTSQLSQIEDELDHESTFYRRETSESISYQNPLFEICNGIHFLNVGQTRLIIRQALLDKILIAYFVNDGNFIEVSNGIWCDDETWYRYLASSFLSPNITSLSSNHKYNGPVYFKEEEVKQFIERLCLDLNGLLYKANNVSLFNNPQERWNLIETHLEELIHIARKERIKTRSSFAEIVNTFANKHGWWRTGELNISTLSYDLTKLGWEAKIKPHLLN
jgi:hypothetical protein